MSTRARVRFDDFGFKYASQKTPAVAGLTAVLEPGQMVAVLGKSGSGKTTILRAVAGLLRHVYPGDETGLLDVSFASALPAATSDGRRYGIVSAYFESESQLTLTTTHVWEEIELALQARCGSAAEAADLSAATARELGASHLLSREVTGLSGGEEKLVGLTACLAAPAGVYLLDEPFEQLDPRRVVAVLQAMNRRARAGAVVVFVTSLIDLAVNAADRLLLHSPKGWSMAHSPSYATLVEHEEELGQSPAFTVPGIDEREPLLTTAHLFRDLARLARMRLQH